MPHSRRLSAPCGLPPGARRAGAAPTRFQPASAPRAAPPAHPAGGRGGWPSPTSGPQCRARPVGEAAAEGRSVPHGTPEKKRPTGHNAPASSEGSGAGPGPTVRRAEPPPGLGAAGTARPAGRRRRQEEERRRGPQRAGLVAPEDGGGSRSSGRWLLACGWRLRARPLLLLRLRPAIDRAPRRRLRAADPEVPQPLRGPDRHTPQVRGAAVRRGVEPIHRPAQGFRGQRALQGAPGAAADPGESRARPDGCHRCGRVAPSCNRRPPRPRGASSGPASSRSGTGDWCWEPPAERGWGGKVGTLRRAVAESGASAAAVLPEPSDSRSPRGTAGPGSRSPTVA